MKTALFALAGACLAVAGCAAVPGGVNSDLIRQTFEAQLRSWNAAGIDPLQLPPEQLLYASLACGTLSSIGTVVNPLGATLSPALAQFCALAIQAAAPAADIAPAVTTGAVAPDIPTDG